ncbi:uncharacterized protein BDZ99DRAFT_575549 [Mytilinidion resinicola]|uniref:Uncharacterized protein n=1 Tax=Mytilinidion resinicola TaxID=574789 RepID=A0A6A6Y674_9PEZI|nr:uncharacterized protein BDZ99DRAFT_575549 [Mytilinidion resinicola]KAF2804326.1 hypothetical protein BDZ99DRAFT_575549 [Mytilinidion resinicola]
MPSPEDQKFLDELTGLDNSHNLRRFALYRLADTKSDPIDCAILQEDAATAHQQVSDTALLKTHYEDLIMVEEAHWKHWQMYSQRITEKADEILRLQKMVVELKPKNLLDGAGFMGRDRRRLAEIQREKERLREEHKALRDAKERMETEFMKVRRVGTAQRGVMATAQREMDALAEREEKFWSFAWVAEERGGEGDYRELKKVEE